MSSENVWLIKVSALTKTTISENAIRIINYNFPSARVYVPRRVHLC